LYGKKSWAFSARSNDEKISFDGEEKNKIWGESRSSVPVQPFLRRPESKAGEAKTLTTKTPAKPDRPSPLCLLFFPLHRPVLF
jgi:hypothetical protein